MEIVVSSFLKRLGYKPQITSGYRCPPHNLDEGGSPTSEHLIANAIDVGFSSWYELFNIVNYALQAGFIRIF